MVTRLLIPLLRTALKRTVGCAGFSGGNGLERLGGYCTRSSVFRSIFDYSQVPIYFRLLDCSFITDIVLLNAKAMSASAGSHVWRSSHEFFGICTHDDVAIQ